MGSRITGRGGRRVAMDATTISLLEMQRSGAARAYAVLHHPALKALAGRTHMEFAKLTPLLCPGPWSLDSAETLVKLGRAARAR